ncbi:hypothetical protein CEXT_602351 [Caerostris extrusa]|uniref:Uncharacterized protein n=1 Tax=Caerostris extrusa TaxID=172846 RepID=A0AAV4SGU6_CAEEX|nr:hypothetical protein CEXT_602351 [Caerostris extrusa]
MRTHLPVSKIDLADIRKKKTSYKNELTVDIKLNNFAESRTNIIGGLAEVISASCSPTSRIVRGSVLENMKMRAAAKWHVGFWHVSWKGQSLVSAFQKSMSNIY